MHVQLSSEAWYRAVYYVPTLCVRGETAPMNEHQNMVFSIRDIGMALGRMIPDCMNAVTFCI